MYFFIEHQIGFDISDEGLESDSFSQMKNSHLSNANKLA